MIIKKRWLAIGVLIILFLILLLFINYRISYFKSISQEVKPVITQTSLNQCLPKDSGGQCQRRMIDGVYVKIGEENYYPTAVIIENQVDARPQAGLTEANLIYEVEAEGGITRLLAIYAAKTGVKKIGPVRSARPYLVDWAEELSALLVHCGGSPEALVKITQDEINDFNEFYHGGYFWRDLSRTAPHNIYTSSANLTKYLQDNKLTQGSFLSWKFKDDLALNLRPATSTIKIAYRAPDYIVEWRYNKKNNDYFRYLAGELHRDESGQIIKAKNIIIQYIKAEVIDNELRLKMDNLGTDKAVACFDGSCQEGSWKKLTSTSRTRFYNQAGVEFEFNAGTTWVEVVRPEIEVTY